MLSCTFFGHRDCPDTVKPVLQKVLLDLITNNGVEMFYVGHQGQFDALVHRTLLELKQQYPQINYTVVLAYMPCKAMSADGYTNTMLPEGIETVHPRYAISWRNNWMLKQSQFVVAYVTHSWGGAAQYVHKAIKQKKSVFNLATLLPSNNDNFQ
jgi:uncharacterized phage-like protein YoqJ